MDTRKFTGKEGRLISAKQALEYTEPFQRREREILDRGENFVKAEFFGIHTFNELIRSFGERCVGFRVYYGLDQQESLINDNKARTLSEKIPTSRLIIVPVDENGRDLTSMPLGGMKDMPAAKDAMSGGPLCPRDC
jgi:hypothetical protein